MVPQGPEACSHRVPNDVIRLSRCLCCSCQHNTRMTPESYARDVRLITFSSPPYQTGAAVGIRPINDVALARSFVSLW